MAKLFETVKGTYDYLPVAAMTREHIKNVLRDVFERYGFPPVETPILCMYDLLASKYSADADILNETYRLSDQGKRDLGLRYDLTICFSKLISSTPGLAMPFKRYEMGKVFRDGPVKLGRNREFTQCDVDVVGVDSLVQEAEFMAMTEEAYRALGLDVQIRWNNRKLLSGILRSLADIGDDAALRKAILLIDKLEKMPKDALAKEFANIDPRAGVFDEIYELLHLDIDSLRLRLEGDARSAQACREGLEEVEELLRLTRGTKAEAAMVFAPYLARGIDIYTGTVWEIFLRDTRVGDVDVNVSLGGGGRYDRIITDFVDDGKPYPAVGMSFGLDAIAVVLEAMRGDAKQATADLFIIPMGTEKAAFDLALALRSRGVRVEIEKLNRRVKKSMAFADKEGFDCTLVLGEDELARGVVTVKRMSSGESGVFALSDSTSIANFVTKL